MYLTEEDYLITIRPYFSAFGSIKEITPSSGWQISFVQDDTIKELLGFEPRVLHVDYNLSDYPVDILYFDNIFLQTDIARGIIFNGRRTGKNHKRTMKVNPAFKLIEIFRVGVQRYKMKNFDFISNISF